MKISIAAIILIMLFPIMAYSSDWICIYHVPPVVTFTNPKTGELNTEHPKNAGQCQEKINTNMEFLPKNHVRFWVSTKLSHGDKGFVWRKDLQEIDCKNKKWRYLQIGFDAFDESIPPEGPYPWYWIEPDSSENALSEIVCK